jgi:hypothetical protein
MENKKSFEQESKILKELSSNLKALHKDLLYFQARHVEEADERRLSSPYDLLKLCIHDPRFHWLRQLSSLILQIDHRLHGKEAIEILDLNSIFDETWGLLHHEDENFSRHYDAALQTDPHLYMKQADVLRSLQELQPLIRDMHEMHVENETSKMKNEWNPGERPG